MPRQRGRSAAPPSRPTVAPVRPKLTPQQPSRSSSTAAHPPTTTAQKAQAGQGPGLFGQMASTAAGVAVGSSIGHTLGGLFGGSSQVAETPSGDTMVASQAQDGTYQSTNLRSCESDAKSFTKCLDENKGSEYQMSVCGWYLEQLKACQSAASQY